MEKFEKINLKIGYPSKWKSYDDVIINRSSYFDSIASISQHDFRKKIKDLTKSVDRDEWMMPPQMVNAFYVKEKHNLIFFHISLLNF